MITSLRTTSYLSPHSLEVFVLIEVCWGFATEYKKSFPVSFYRKNKHVVKQRGNIFNDQKSCILVVVLNVLLSIFLAYPGLTTSTCNCLGDVLSAIFPPVPLFPHFLSIQTSFLSIWGIYLCEDTQICHLRVAQYFIVYI